MTMMKRTMTILMLVLCTLVASAQDKKKFSPAKFESDLAAYITREASLTQEEASKILPLLKEMHDKQRSLMEKQRQSAKQKPADDKQAAQAIEQADRLAIELKQIEQQYHKKMVKAVSAQKVYAAIKAESKFHRRMMKDFQHKQGKDPKDRPHAKPAKNGKRQ